MVCFATLMCLVVASGVLLYDVLQVVSPQFTLQYYEPYASNDSFLKFYPDKAGLPEEQLGRLRVQSFRAAVAGERRRALQSAVFAALVIMINIVVYAGHWRIARNGGSGNAPAGV